MADLIVAIHERAATLTEADCVTLARTIDDDLRAIYYALVRLRPERREAIARLERVRVSAIDCLRVAGVEVVDG